jgi:protein ImuA
MGEGLSVGKNPAFSNAYAFSLTPAPVSGINRTKHEQNTDQAMAIPQMTTAVLIDRLRRKLSAAEAATGLTGGTAPLTLGIPAIDGTLGGGLGRGALHEIAAVRESEIAAATGFALALAARNSSTSTGKSVLWIAEDLSLAENGAPYGPGLDEAGIAPERLITVAAARARDVLWAMEEALRCRAVGVTIGELRARDIDQVASRRLSLAAAAGDTLGLILRTAPDDAPSAAATRWIIGAAPSSLSESNERFHGIGPPRIAARLVRNRRGHLGAWIMEWNSVEQRFELATDSEPVAGAAFDRPRRAAVA